MIVKCTSSAKDVFYIVHIVFFLMGLSHNIPVTFFTNATNVSPIITKKMIPFSTSLRCFSTGCINSEIPHQI